MTKDLSKQICEKCGIKPEYNYILEGKANFKMNVNKKWLKDNLEYKGYYDWKVKQVTKNYPNFGQPENFVKLFELVTDIEDFYFETGVSFYSAVANNIRSSILHTPDGEYGSNERNSIKAFLECVYECIQHERDTAEYIREAEWKYE